MHCTLLISSTNRRVGSTTGCGQGLQPEPRRHARRGAARGVRECCPISRTAALLTRGHGVRKPRFKFLTPGLIYVSGQTGANGSPPHDRAERRHRLRQLRQTAVGHVLRDDGVAFCRISQQDLCCLQWALARPRSTHIVGSNHRLPTTIAGTPYWGDYPDVRPFWLRRSEPIVHRVRYLLQHRHAGTTSAHQRDECSHLNESSSTAQEAVVAGRSGEYYEQFRPTLRPTSVSPARCCFRLQVCATG